jgi:hypothetical protein
MKVPRTRKIEGVHRIMYMARYGSIPKGKFVLHRCDVRSCANPDHLFIGTPYDNTRDMVNKGRANGYRRLGGAGVWRRGRKFIARCNIKGKRLYLGMYDSFEEAAAATKAARERLS